MKRWICFVCLVALCVFAISCQKEASIDSVSTDSVSIDSVSIDQCIYYADDFLKKASENTEFYKFEGDYNDLVNAYVVLMSVDEDYIVSLVNSMDIKEDYRSMMTAITLNNHDSNYDAIESAITDIKSGELEELFEGKDVLFEYGYVSRDGEITWY